MNVFHTLGRSDDLELEQCYVRLFIPLPILVCWYLFWSVRMHNAVANGGLWVAASFLVLALGHWAHVKCYPGFHPWRRVLAIAMDQGACFTAMFLTGELGAVVAFVNLWVSLGNGIRFGVKWMVFSSSLTLLGLMGLAAYSDYWGQHLTWIASLILLNVAIPTYVANLISGFHEGRIKLAQYANEMEIMAMEDALTGLPNRHALFGELERASSLAQRMGASIAVLYFDLDGFKQVNDSLGHTLGDMLLRETAIRVKKALRGEDVLARIGGDEFVVLLQVQDFEAQVAETADRILESIASIDDVSGKLVDVTASVGIVLVSGVDAVRLGAEELVHEADQNMYAAKKAGKNQVVLTSLSTGLTPAVRRA